MVVILSLINTTTGYSAMEDIPIPKTLYKITWYSPRPRKVRDHRISSYKVTWLFLLKQEDTKNKYETISGLEALLPEGTQVVLLVLSSTEVKTVYSAAVNHKGDIRFQQSSKIGSPNPELKIHQPNDPEIYRDLKGRHLTVASISLIPYMVLSERHEDGSHTVVGGIESQVLEALAYALNFTPARALPLSGWLETIIRSTWGLLYLRPVGRA
ncbi:hypothetical protein SK128_015642 [Halocaridina rubra]|uniref:Uncharacterized protein n=1 Tax=Halocaridina rubra TaxID=373956 RepID=A0AAN9A921_HALRR